MQRFSIIITILLVGLCPCIFAEVNPTIDSLLLVLGKADDSEKYDIFLSLSDEYLGLDNKTGIGYVEKVIADSMLVSDVLLAKAYQKLGSTLIHDNDNQAGLKNLSIAYHKFIAIDDNGSYGSELGSTCISRGRAERIIGHNFSALKIFLRGIEHFRSSQDLSGEADCINHIGIVFNNIQDFESAKEYYLKCQDIYEKLGNDKGRVYILNNLGYVEDELGNYLKAMEFYDRGLSLAREIDFTTMEIHLLSNLSHLSVKQKNYTKAQSFIDQGLPLSKVTGHTRLSKFFDLNKAIISLKVERSQRYFNEVLDINEFAKAKGFKFLETYSLEVLKEFYLEANKFKEAFEITEFQKVQADSLNKSKLLRETSFLKSKFEYENEEKNKELEQSEAASFKRLLTTLLIFSGLGFLLSFLFIKKLRASNKDLNEKNQKLEVADKILEDRNKQLQMYIDSNAQLKKFARSTSHDIRSPIRTIGSYADLLRKNIFDTLDDKSKMHLNFITEGASRLYDITADMLNLATGGGKELYLEKVNTIYMVNDVLKDLAYVIDIEKAEVTVGQLPKSIVVDKIKMRRIFQNIVENAIKYKHPQRAPKVHISAQELESHHQFSIKDNGIGIDPSQVDQIFKVFSRLEETKEKDGIGIGLSICRNIIEKHGGRIWVNQEYSGGTEFCFTVPV